MKHSFVVDEEGARAQRLDRLIVKLIPDVSRSAVQRWVAEGLVLLDGEPARARARLRVGMVIEVTPGRPPPSRAEPDPSVAIDALFEDEHLIVVHKPPGLVVHPGAGHPTGTLVNGLLARPGFRVPPADPRDADGALRPGIVHRLDKDTSGVLVVAKDARTREGLKEQLSSHSMEREYRALTHGVPRSETIETWHGRHPVHRQRFTSELGQGRRAVTRISVLERLMGGRAALLSCRLETGRTHQIRVHLAEQSRAPVLGDVLYARAPRDPELRAVVDALGRHALHAAVLGFIHPVTGGSLHFEAPLPEDMSAALAALRRE